MAHFPRGQMQRWQSQRATIPVQKNTDIPKPLVMSLIVLMPSQNMHMHSGKSMQTCVVHYSVLKKLLKRSKSVFQRLGHFLIWPTAFHRPPIQILCEIHHKIILHVHTGSINSVWQKGETKHLAFNNNKQTVRKHQKCGWIMYVLKSEANWPYTIIIPVYKNKIWLQELFDGIESWVLARAGTVHKN